MQFGSFFYRKFTFGPLGDVNSSLDSGVGAMTHSSEVTCLGTIDLGSEVPGHSQQRILGGVDVTGTSEPQILALSSALRSVAPTSKPWISASSLEPWILALSMDSKPTAKIPLPRLLSFLPPSSP